MSSGDRDPRLAFSSQEKKNLLTYLIATGEQMARSIENGMEVQVESQTGRYMRRYISNHCSQTVEGGIREVTSSSCSVAVHGSGLLGA